MLIRAKHVLDKLLKDIITRAKHSKISQKNYANIAQKITNIALANIKMKMKNKTPVKRKTNYEACIERN